MSTKTYSFAYGREQKEVTIDTDRLIKEIRTHDFPVMKNIKEGILEAIHHPIGLPSLAEIIKPGQTVAFICNDLTRVANSFDFMPVFLDEMNRLGVPDENITIVFSLGTHRPMTRDEMITAVGEDVVNRVKTVNSVSTVDEDFEYQGTTSRGTPVYIHKALCHVDHVILTGTIVHHYFSGYGGGRKAILPGCAAMETVRVNHSFMLDENAELGHMDGNPCYDDQMEGVALFAKGRSLFLFNAVLNAKHQFLKMFAGHYDLAHREACHFVDEVYGVPIEEQADLVIASCGGYPKDINVYQMQKTMDNTMYAVKEGGVVILLAECIEGSGSAKLEETFARLKTPEAIRRELETDFRIGANKAFAITRPQGRARYILVSKLPKAMAKQMLYTDSVESVPEAMAIAQELIGHEPSIILMPEGSLTVPLYKRKVR